MDENALRATIDDALSQPHVDYQKAHTACKALLDIVPEDKLVLTNLIVCASHIGAFDELQPRLEQLLALDSNFQPAIDNALFALDTLINQQQAEKAQTLLAFMTTHYQTNLPVLKRLIYPYRKLDDVDKLLDLLNLALSLNSRDTETIEALYQFFLDYNSIENIKKLAVHTQKVLPQDGFGDFLLASYYSFYSDNEICFKHLQKAFEQGYTKRDCLALLTKYASMTTNSEMLYTLYDYAIENKVPSAFVAELIKALITIAAFDKVSKLKEIFATTRQDGSIITPFTTLAFVEDLAVQKQITTYCVETKHPFRHPYPRRTKNIKGRPLRVGYFGANFNNHPEGMLLAQIIPNHTKALDVFVYSYTLVEDDYTQSIKRRAVFRNCRALSMKETAKLIYEDDIDLLIDIAALTGRFTGEIHTYKPARKHASMIGYSGTLGLPEVDYYITTKTAVPETMQQHFVEEVVYLPEANSFLAEMSTPNTSLTRADLGIPEDVFAFGVFSAAYRIDEKCFMAYLAILKQTTNSVLCINIDTEEQLANYQKYMQKEGVSLDKLIPLEPRMLSTTWHNTLMDLILDTFSLTAGTAGLLHAYAEVPVLTLLGNTPQSRESAIKLKAMLLEEMIAPDVASYIQKAVSFAHNKETLTPIKEKLAKAKKDSALFNIDKFMPPFEALLQELVAK